MDKKVLITIVFALTVFSGWIAFTNIDWFNQIQDIVRESGAWGYCLFIAAYAIATLLILPVTAFNIAGGAIFGAVQGLLLTSIGALISALLAFILARIFAESAESAESIGLKHGVKHIASNVNSDRWSNVSDRLVAGGISYSFAARLLPLIPYGVVSFAAGLSPIKRRDYLLGTLLGTPLGIAPFVFLGSTGVQVGSSHDVIPLLASSAGLAILVILATWYRQQSQTKV
jgi:uncharacterized membrane protein YdjX (TVP38/TMEM64 family)